MDDVREELKREVLCIDDSAMLGKVEAFVRGMQAEKEIGRKVPDDPPGQSKGGKEGETHG